jgi:hypothetical protein
LPALPMYLVHARPPVLRTKGIVAGQTGTPEVASSLRSRPGRFNVEMGQKPCWPHYQGRESVRLPVTRKTAVTARASTRPRTHASYRY